MTANSHLDHLTSVYFNKKRDFSASQDLATMRSQRFILQPSSRQVDLWNLKPPDFSRKLYINQCPLQKEVKKHKPLFTCDFSESALGLDKVTPVILLPEIDMKRKAMPKFSTSSRTPDSLEYKLMFVKTGTYPAVAYKNPKPHNFRPIADDMTEIFTAFESNPGHFNFKSQHLSTISGIRSDADIYSRETMEKMNTYKPKEPRWEARLTLPKLPWPPKSASYTRHRRRRGAYSAFMDRVEEKMTVSGFWKTC